MQGEGPRELAGPDVWQACRELIPAGSVFAFLAGHREALFPAEMFADMYPSRNGRPSMPPQVLAVTVVLQALYGLPDSEAVQALRGDLRWKAACGLGLLDPGFDPSLLTYFRRRLPGSGDPGRLFAKVKEVAAATGVLAGKHRRALDSTVLDDAVATKDTVTQLVAAVRRVIREVPGAAEAAAARCSAHDYRDPGKPRIAWDDEEARATLVSALVSDALSLRAALPGQPGGPAADAIGLLAPGRPAVPGGFTADDFTIDDQAGTVTCPAGHTAGLGRPHPDGTRQAQFKALCRDCPLRQRCTTSKTGRVLSVHPQRALLAAARRAAADPAWQEEYRRWRPPVERAIAWLVARGNRRVPYRGITKNNAWLANRAAALNLRRLTNLGLTRTTEGTW